MRPRSSFQAAVHALYPKTSQQKSQTKDSLSRTQTVMLKKLSRLSNVQATSWFLSLFSFPLFGPLSQEDRRATLLHKEVYDCCGAVAICLREKEYQKPYIYSFIKRLFFFFPMFSRDLQKLTLRSGDCELNWGGEGVEKVEGTGHEYVLPCGPLKYCQDEEPCAASNKRLLLDPFPLLIWNSCQSPAVCRPQSLIQTGSEHN